MTKDTQTTNATIEALDMKKPIWLVLYQTDTRNVMDAFQGDEAEAEAKAEASRRAKRTGRQVAVFGPQGSVYAPPPTVEAQEVQLDWTKPDA